MILELTPYALWCVNCHTQSEIVHLTKQTHPFHIKKRFPEWITNEYHSFCPDCRAAANALTDFLREVIK